MVNHVGGRGKETDGHTIHFDGPSLVSYLPDGPHCGYRVSDKTG
jgi:hypothetical protein